MKTKSPTNPSRRKTAPKAGSTRQAFVAHLQELRRRLYFCAFAIALWGVAIYSVQQHVVNLMLKPSHGQRFIYTSPIGGIDFLFKICIYGGVILSLPVIVYNILRFIEPVLNGSTRRFIIWQSLACAALALAGMAFGYFIGLPSALQFLLHQFQTIQIQPLVTIQSYLSFVIVYMVGSALLFQMPLFLLFINRIRPLKPQRLFHYERWVILAAFILSGLLNPTPNILSQLLIAGPFILMYQIGIGLIWLINRRHATEAVEAAPTINLSDTRRLARYMIRKSLRVNRPARPVRLISDVAKA